ncbi:hypothetical protein B0J11DRAFT_539414 [Dendryphion nanum]|uniref:Uncharacterized protein n=1 Tax=Dendryphion nanum TaxID=256645 RepID=A0A9P9D9E4_9PLEO|nr:hypothetical protein B0J11DRAFT_539414 [Dendryphion nanum]
MFLKQPNDKPNSMARPARQCCFICFGGKRQQEYAVLVPCFRPNPQPRIRKIKTKEGTERLNFEIFRHDSFESDSTIYKRLNEVCYQHQPKFKRWIPFYGVVEVREVKFRFLGIKDKSNRHRVHIYRLNINEIGEEAKNTIAISRHPDYWDTYGCCDEWHSDACPASTDYTAEPCIVKRVEVAQLRRNNLETYSLLTDCVRDPQSADEYETLKGMAQESPIIDLKISEIDDQSKVFGRKNEMPGLEFIMGWQFDRMESELPFFVFCILLITLAIWIVVIVSGLAGEWTLSTALGQIALGSVAILVGLRYLV